MSNGYNHYFRDVTQLTHIDVYRVLSLFGVSDPSIQHAIKKLMVAGGRGAKNTDKDIAEAIVSLQRWQQMQEEDKQRVFVPSDAVPISITTLQG